MAFSSISIFGTSNDRGFSVPLLQLDTDLLGAYYNSRVNLALASTASLVRGADVDQFGPDVIPPWELTPPGKDDAAARLLSPKSLIDLDHAALNRAGITDEVKSLFAAYQGLRKMQELARYAANDPQGISMALILQSQWTRYEGELRSYIGGLEFDDITLPTMKTWPSLSIATALAAAAPLSGSTRSVPTTFGVPPSPSIFCNMPSAYAPVPLVPAM